MSNYSAEWKSMTEHAGKKQPLDLRAVETLRCERTGNPPGTDTMMLGTCCPCRSCREYFALIQPLLTVLRETRAALKHAIEELREAGHEYVPDKLAAVLASVKDD